MPRERRLEFPVCSSPLVEKQLTLRLRVEVSQPSLIALRASHFILQLPATQVNDAKPSWFYVVPEYKSIDYWKKCHSLIPRWSREICLTDGYQKYVPHGGLMVSPPQIFRLYFAALSSDIIFLACVNVVGWWVNNLGTTKHSKNKETVSASKHPSALSRG